MARIDISEATIDLTDYSSWGIIDNRVSVKPLDSGYQINLGNQSETISLITSDIMTIDLFHALAAELGYEVKAIEQEIEVKLGASKTKTLKEELTTLRRVK